MDPAVAEAIDRQNRALRQLGERAFADQEPAPVDGPSPDRDRPRPAPRQPQGCGI